MDIVFNCDQQINCEDFFRRVGFEHLQELQAREDESRLKTVLSTSTGKYMVKAGFHDTDAENQEMMLQDPMENFVTAFNAQFADDTFSLQLQPINYAIALSPETASSFLPWLISERNAGQQLLVSYAPFIENGISYNDLTEDQQSIVINHIKTIRQFAHTRGLILLDFDAGQLLYQVDSNGSITAHVIDYEEWEQL